MKSSTSVIKFGLDSILEVTNLSFRDNFCTAISISLINFRCIPISVDDLLGYNGAHREDC